LQRLAQRDLKVLAFWVGMQILVAFVGLVTIENIQYHLIQ
jgi:hypothetical protein